MRKYIIPVLGTTLIAAGYLCLENHESKSIEQTEFTIEKPYLQTVKALATKNSLERIVEESDGKVTEKKWDNFNVEVPQRVLRIREYALDGTLRFTVEKKDRDLGELKLHFIQKMSLDKNLLSLRTSLAEPQPHIPSYNKTVEIRPEETLSKTHVAAKSELKIRKTIPFFFRDYMDKKVAETNRKDLERLKENILEVSEGH